jgi:hypothetical protein
MQDCAKRACLEHQQTNLASQRHHDANRFLAQITGYERLEAIDGLVSRLERNKLRSAKSRAGISPPQSSGVKFASIKQTIGQYLAILVDHALFMSLNILVIERPHRANLLFPKYPPK